jgi:type I restriction enzyme R subunit
MKVPLLLNTLPYKTAAEYQNEVYLERKFMQLLSGQRYEYLAIHNKAALIDNLRLNNFTQCL